MGEEKGRVLAQVLWAAHDDDIATLQKLWKEEDGPALLNGADYDKRTPLHVAASNNSLRAAELLLRAGAVVDPLDLWSHTPLVNAQQLGYKFMVKLLLQYGARQPGQDHSPRGGDRNGFVAPPPHNWDWLSIDPSEINLTDAKLIGKGSFGEIRLATWRGTAVAVKTIRPSLSRVFLTACARLVNGNEAECRIKVGVLCGGVVNDPKDREVVKDFMNEVELLVKLRHPNIVQFLGAAIKQPPLMLVTEYLPGGDLHALIQKGPVPASLAVTFALDMARGMAYLHGGPNAIIHRDLKPRNLIIDESHDLKVGDFGLSKLVRGKNMYDVYKLTGETGSYRYMAPEVFLHQKYNTKVDVFSFAMILYEMFEGAAPFSTEDAYVAASMVANDNKRPEFGLKTRYPEGMKDLITSCWVDFAEKRPDFESIVEELQSIQQKMPQQDRHRFRHILQRIHRRLS